MQSRRVEASRRGIATILQKLQREQCGACLAFDGSRCNPWKRESRVPFKATRVSVKLA